MTGASEFDEFVGTQSRQLLRTAWLLTGNWAGAEDLVQTTLTAVWQRWANIAELDFPEAYVRRVLVNTYLSSQRRSWIGERPTAVLPDTAAADAYAARDQRMVVTDALNTLPPKQRSVVVLRYFAELTEQETAVALNCSVGNVKSQASRALAKLRAIAELDLLLKETC